MKRRQFITLLGGAAAQLPAELRECQKAAMPVIGILNSGSPDASASLIQSLRTGLGETGFVEGQNLTDRSTDGQMADTTCCRRWPPIWC